MWLCELRIRRIIEKIFLYEVLTLGGECIFSVAQTILSPIESDREPHPLIVKENICKMPPTCF